MKRMFAAFLILLTLTSCFRASKVPVNTISYPFKNGIRQECLVIFLPGRGDSAGDFDHEGFIAALRRTGINADLIAVDLHFGYYMDMTAVERLRHDVIVPARAQGYRNLLLVGISIGGLAALEYERKYPGDVGGIVLMAPYLGRDQILDEIASAGGISKWKPGRIAKSDHERRIWAWVRDYKLQGRRTPVIYLAYGRQDRFAQSDRLLAEAVGQDRTITGPGGHSWSTWRKLWNQVVGRISCSTDQKDRLVDADRAEYNK